MKYLTVDEFRELGLLLETNRQLLHPLGLAMEARVVADDEYVATHGNVVYTLILPTAGIVALRKLSAHARVHEALPAEHLDDLDRLLDEAEDNPNAAVLRVQDHQDDPEGVYFADLEPADLERVQNGWRLRDERRAARFNALGYVVQPLHRTTEGD